jgi:hypothetical protein
MNPQLREIGRLAQHVKCEIDMQRGGKIILKRKKMALTGALHPLAAMAWLHRETQRWDEAMAKAKLARQQHH